MSEKISRESIIRSLLNSAFYKSAEGTSLSDIADSLGVKKASLYNHFGSRDDIMAKTVSSCENYLNELSLIPSEIQSVAQKYPVATVFKGIVSRWIKLHEKNPLFQIYTFVESRKYFDQNAAEIVRKQNERLVAQTEIVLESLFSLNKISVKKEKIHPVAVWFCAGMNDIMSCHLLSRKRLVVENPESGDGELFTLQSDDEKIEKINVLVEEFCNLIDAEN